ncbi:hypothetical protein [Pseudobutyrivibrio sp.]
MKNYKRRQYVFSFTMNGEKTYHDVKMLPRYTREEALARFKKSNPLASDVKIESTSIVTIQI